MYSRDHWQSLILCDSSVSGPWMDCYGHITFCLVLFLLRGMCAFRIFASEERLDPAKALALRSSALVIEVCSLAETHLGPQIVPPRSCLSSAPTMHSSILRTSPAVSPTQPNHFKCTTLEPGIRVFGDSRWRNKCRPGHMHPDWGRLGRLDWCHPWD